MFLTNILNDEKRKEGSIKVKKLYVYILRYPILEKCKATLRSVIICNWMAVPHS